MSGIEAYNQHANAYDLWFEDNQAAYLSELNAVKSLLPTGKGVEIGAGGGRFAKPLGIVEKNKGLKSKRLFKPCLKTPKIFSQPDLVVVMELS